MATLNNPHDRFFKRAFGQREVAGEFLQRFLPAAVVERLDWTTVEPEKDAFWDDTLHEHAADLLYRITLHGGQSGYIHLLFEHKSYVERQINLDLLRYRVRIWEQWGKDFPASLPDTPATDQRRLPVIIPVVFYHGTTSWNVPQQFADTVVDEPALHDYIPHVRYHLVDLSHYRDEQLKGGVIMQTALLVFKYIFRDELPERIHGIFGLLRTLEQHSEGIDYIRALLVYLTQATATDRLTETQLRDAVTHHLIDQGEQLMMTIAQEWEQRGEKRGKQLGKAEGEQQLLRRLLIRKFGRLPDEVERRLTEADTEQLEQWADNVLFAQTLAEVFE